MDDHQRLIFVRAAAMGVACGLEHRFEWFVNANRALMHGAYTDIAEDSKRLIDAFIAFEQQTASNPEDEADLDKLTPEKYGKMVDEWYARARKHSPQLQLPLPQLQLPL